MHSPSKGLGPRNVFSRHGFRHVLPGCVQWKWNNLRPLSIGRVVGRTALEAHLHLTATAWVERFVSVSGAAWRKGLIVGCLVDCGSGARLRERRVGHAHLLHATSRRGSSLGARRAVAVGRAVHGRLVVVCRASEGPTRLVLLALRLRPRWWQGEHVARVRVPDRRARRRKLQIRRRWRRTGSLRLRAVSDGMLLAQASHGLGEEVVESWRERRKVGAPPRSIFLARAASVLVRSWAVLARLRLQRLQHGMHPGRVQERRVFLHLGAEHTLGESHGEASANAGESLDVRHEPKRAMFIGDVKVGPLAGAPVGGVLDHELCTRTTSDVT